MASAPRSGNTPWLCAHTLTCPPSQQAIAQLGAIEPCAMNGRVNSAARVWRTCAAACASSRRTTGWSSVGWDSRKPFRSSSSGSDSRTVHRAARASCLAAVTAARSVSAITPRNEPSRTCATTPAGRSASPTPSRVAAGAGGRITRPNSMPGSIWSCRKRGRPVALSGRSIRGALRPATRHWAGGLAAAVSCAARSRRVASSSDQ